MKLSTPVRRERDGLAVGRPGGRSVNARRERKPSWDTSREIEHPDVEVRRTLSANLDRQFATVGRKAGRGEIGSRPRFPNLLSAAVKPQKLPVSDDSISDLVRQEAIFRNSENPPTDARVDRGMFGQRHHLPDQA